MTAVLLYNFYSTVVGFVDYIAKYFSANYSFSFKDDNILLNVSAKFGDGANNQLIQLPIQEPKFNFKIILNGFKEKAEELKLNDGTNNIDQMSLLVSSDKDSREISFDRKNEIEDPPLLLSLHLETISEEKQLDCTGVDSDTENPVAP